MNGARAPQRTPSRAAWALHECVCAPVLTHTVVRVCDAVRASLQVGEAG